MFGKLRPNAVLVRPCTTPLASKRTKLGSLRFLHEILSNITCLHQAYARTHTLCKNHLLAQAYDSLDCLGPPKLHHCIFQVNNFWQEHTSEDPKILGRPFDWPENRRLRLRHVQRFELSHDAPPNPLHPKNLAGGSVLTNLISKCWLQNQNCGNRFKAKQTWSLPSNLTPTGLLSNFPGSIWIKPPQL
jgi:hypothetical protein